MKHLKKTILSVSILLAVSINAQNFEWAKTFGGNYFDRGQSLCVDALGNVYTTGFFNDTADFDPGEGTDNHTVIGGYDIFVQKIDASGNFLWAKTFGGPASDQAFSISVDTSGNVYVTGSFYGTADFDPGEETANFTAVGINDIFVLKLDSFGNFLWVKTFGGTSVDISRSISVDASGNVYTTGYFEGIVDFDPGLGVVNIISAGLSDIFVQKLDSTGNLIWVKTFGGSDNDQSHSISIDSSGYIYTTGYFRGAADFDPGIGTANLISVGLTDIYVHKLDASGNFLWVKSFGGTNSDEGNSIIADLSGNIFITGYFRGTVDFDTGITVSNQTSSGSGDIFVQKMDSSGNFIWSKSFGGIANDIGNSICVDSNGDVYSTGIFGATVDFDPGIGTEIYTATGATYGIFVQKMDAAGSFHWAKAILGTSIGMGLSINVDELGSAYITGSFSGTVDFDPGADSTILTSTGTVGMFEDIFVQKMSQCFPTLRTDTITTCNSYTWIDGITYISNNNTATYLLANVNGCDSIVTLDLTIHIISDTIILFNDSSVTATNAGASYRWLDCNNNFAFISGETNQSFTTNSEGSYAVELTENGCVDTSACLDIVMAGILENYHDKTVKVNPNPSDGNFVIDLGDFYQNVEVITTDLSGKVIESRLFKGAKVLNFEIDQPAGTYLVSIYTGDKKRFIKLIKK